MPRNNSNLPLEVPVTLEELRSGNRARVQRYRAIHRRIDYVPSPDVLSIIEHHLKIGTDPCVVGVIDPQGFGEITRIL